MLGLTLGPLPGAKTGDGGGGKREESLRWSREPRAALFPTLGLVLQRILSRCSFNAALVLILRVLLPIQ